MRYLYYKPTIIFICLALIVIGCQGGKYANPVSPQTTPTVWRAITVTDAGGTFALSDIGAYLSFPADAIATGEVHVFNIRLNPEGVPLVPGGSVFVAMGTVEISGTLDVFDAPVEIQWQIAEEKRPGISTQAHKLNDDRKWEFSQNAVVLSDGLHVTAFITSTGIYGSFIRVPLHVEATASMTQGPAPLSVGFKAIVTGGRPPYSVVWEFGDNSKPEGGMTVGHYFPDPGEWTVTCIVYDGDGISVTDWLNLVGYGQSGPPYVP